MNKKIGQLTYYRGNYGSILQCYATQILFKNMGYEISTIEVVDRLPLRCIHAVNRRIVLLAKLIAFPRYTKEIFRLYTNAINLQKGSLLSNKCKEEMEQFIKTNINITICSEAELRRFAHSDEYLLFLSGSDQIWSASWPIPNPYYFLTFAPPKKRVAWAPSFGSSSLPVYNKKTIQRWISRYNVLSIREKSGQEIIRSFTDKKCEVLNDPVLQIDKKYWDKLNLTNSLFSDKYICLFFIDTPSEDTKRYVYELKHETGYRVINFAYNHRFDFDVNYLEGGPVDFLSVIENAELVLTDSFHATAFSIIFHTNFITIKRNYMHTSDQSTRITDLLHACQLVDRYATDCKDYRTALSTTKIFNTDFSKADLYIEMVRRHSNLYIDQILNNMEDK
jgi:hypothetical protein